MTITDGRVPHVCENSSIDKYINTKTLFKLDAHGGVILDRFYIEIFYHRERRKQFPYQPNETSLKIRFKDLNNYSEKIFEDKFEQWEFSWIRKEIKKYSDYEKVDFESAYMAFKKNLEGRLTLMLYDNAGKDIVYNATINSEGELE